jgi:endonuclease/exonuclease/phosphatase family metal-dependent hydrolase
VIRRRHRGLESGQPRITVATYNIHTCVGVDRRYDPARTAAVLRELGADILGLQEVDARHRQSGHVDQWAYFAAATEMRAISGINAHDHRGRFGNAILTRFPVLAVRQIDLSVRGYEPRSAIDADLLVHGRVMRVVATHLGLRAGERRYQIERLLDVVLGTEEERDGVLFMGDLNERRGRRGGISVLDRRLGRAPTPRTFPSWMPILPLDRIYAGGAAALGITKVHRSPLARLASDHLPLKAAVGWRDPAER